MQIGLVVKADPGVNRKADELEHWLRQRNVSVWRLASQPPNRQHPEPDPPAPPPTDLRFVLVLGGDGTFLSAVRWIADRDIPILGVKFGAVGFLAGASAEDWVAVLEQILEQGFATRPRMRLQVRVLREGRPLANETVLNDIVINKGALARLACIETFIDDHYLTAFRADGLIVSTPTGSTAYSLAAGGPVLHPDVPGIIMTPICPFTLTNRPLIVPDQSNIHIRLARESSDIILTFDGQVGMAIDERDEITVRQSPHPIRIIEIPGQRYFDVLKTKLRWSGSRV